MNLEELIIAFFRILASTIVFKFNFIGGLFVIFIDFSDLIIMNMVNLGGVRNYQMLDKLLDLFYIIYFLIITLRWERLLRNISITLFIFRILGFFLFEFFQNRLILFIFPNIFEFWFLGIALLLLLKIEISKKKIIIIFLVTTFLKLIQEYILHVWKVLDNYKATEVFNSMIEIFS